MRRWEAARPGQSVLEMAILAPVFALILLGTLDFGRVFIYQNRVNSAIKEAAILGLYQPRTAVVTSRAYQEVTDPETGRQLLGTPGTDFVVESVYCYEAVNPSLRKSCANPAPGDAIEVTGYYIFTPITSQIIRFLPTSLQIRKVVRVVY